MRIVSRAQYLSEGVPQMRPVDHDATHLVKAVKGRTLHPKAYTYVNIGNVRTKITDANKDAAIEWFSEWAAPQINGLGLGPKILIPIPGHNTLSDSAADFRTAIIANSIAHRCAGAIVAPILRFRTEMLPSSAGGPRDPKLIYPNLAPIQQFPAGIVVLIDDVYTTGGHLVAASWRVEDAKRNVALAVACGRTLHYQLNDPFVVDPEEKDTTRV